MKKLLLMAIVAGGVFAANASYLIWQVNGSDASTAAYGDWNAAMVYKVSGLSDSAIATWNANANKEKDTALTGATLVEVNKSAENFSTDYGSAVATMPKGMSAAADIATVTGYAYYIELVNYDFSNDKVNYVYARSDAVAYSALSGSITDSLSTATIANVSPWHGGGYSAVPEPTSGLMLLLGAAMLGLRRKNRSVA